jgi:hypothetical protein
MAFNGLDLFAMCNLGHNHQQAEIDAHKDVPHHITPPFKNSLQLDFWSRPPVGHPTGGFHKLWYPQIDVFFGGKSQEKMDENWGEPLVPNIRKPPYQKVRKSSDS